MSIPPVPLRIVQSVHSLRTDHGGPSRSVSALAAAVRRAGADATLVSRDDSSATLIGPDSEVAHVLVAADGQLRSLFLGNAALRLIASDADVVHDHGLWLGANRQTCSAAIRAGVPLVISPRGMLSAWALDFKRARKRLAWFAYQRSLLHGASLLHATAPSEADDIREQGLRAPIVLLPNAVDLPTTVRAHVRKPEQPRRALFLSRLHPKKGLLNLVRAWAEAAPQDWELVLAGPEEDEHWSLVRKAADAAGAAGVSWVGEVADDAKWDLYRSADLFVLPTFSENYGIVVAEALAAGVPAIVTKGAPWDALRAERCGWWIDVGVHPLVDALREATKLSDSERADMGLRGRAFVERTLSWNAVGTEMLAAYNWISGRGPRPESVLLS